MKEFYNWRPMAKFEFVMLVVITLLLAFNRIRFSEIIFIFAAAGIAFIFYRVVKGKI